MRLLRFLVFTISLICLFTPAFAQTVMYLPEHTEALESHPLYNKPVFAIKDTTLNGSAFDMDRHKDQIIVLHFWNLRCAACYKEIPELNLISDAYKDKNVLVISMMDDSIRALTEKIAMSGAFYRLKKPVFGNDEINFEIIPEAKETMLRFKSEHIPYGFPTTYFIKRGQLREFSFGYLQSYGNPKPAESKNYVHIKEVVDRLLLED